MSRLVKVGSMVPKLKWCRDEIHLSRLLSFAKDTHLQPGEDIGERRTPCGSQALEWRCDREITMASLNAHVERRHHRNSIHLSCFTLFTSPFYCIAVAFCPSSHPLLTLPHLPTLPPSQSLNLTLPPFATHFHPFWKRAALTDRTRQWSSCSA